LLYFILISDHFFNLSEIFKHTLMTYPVLIIDFTKYKELADNVWNAQMAKHPRILTYDGPSLENRKGAMHYEVEEARFVIPSILSRDEYPFACTREGGASSWIGHIPGRQNSAQGGLIAGFLRRNGIQPKKNEDSKFEVRVINHPNGNVI